MKTQYVTDDSGNKLAVILPIKTYQKMIEELEDIEDVILYDQAKADKGDSIPIDEAFRIIEEEREKEPCK